MNENNLLMEMLTSVSLEQLKKFLKNRFKLDLNNFVIRENDFGRGVQEIHLSSDIFTVISERQLDSVLKTYGYCISKKFNSYIIVRQTYKPHQSTTSQFDWNDKEDEIRSGKFYHITGTEIPIGSCIVPKASLADDRFEKYDERIYLVSSVLSEQNFEYGPGTEKIISYLANKLKSSHHFSNLYIYECEIPKNFDIYIDEAFSAGIYVKNPISKFRLKKIFYI